MRRVIYFSCLLSLLLPLGSCGETDQGPFPLGNNSWWEYSVERSVIDMRLHQKYIVANLPAREIDGVTVYPKRLAGGNLELYRKTEWGIVLQHANDGPESLILPQPLEATARWREKSRIMFVDIPGLTRPDIWSTVKSVDMEYSVKSMDESVRVRAGVFPHCIRIESTGLLEVGENIKLFVGVRQIRVKQTDWYAPGVGLVKREREEDTSPTKFHGRYIQQLASFKP